MRVGDLVTHKDSWDDYLFIVTEIDSPTIPLMCRCTIIRTPSLDAEYEIGYTLRWKPFGEWSKYENR